MQSKIYLNPSSWIVFDIKNKSILIECKEIDENIKEKLCFTCDEEMIFKYIPTVVDDKLYTPNYSSNY